MVFKTVQNLVLTSRNVNQGPVNIHCPLHSLEMEYDAIKYRWPSQQERILVSRKQFRNGKKTSAGLDLYKTEQELIIPHSGRQFCNPGLRHHAS